MQLARYAATFGKYYVEAIYARELRAQRGNPARAIAGTITYFMRESAKLDKARKNALDVNRHDRGEEMRLRHLYGEIDVEKPVLDAFRDDMTRHEIDGGSRKSGKRRQDKTKVLKSTWLTRAMYET